MHTKLAVVLLLTLLTVNSFVYLANAQPVLQTVEWCKTFGYGDACIVLRMGNGNFLIAAQSSPTYHYVGHLGFTYNSLQGKLFEINSDGTVIHTTAIPLLPEAIQTDNGSLVIAGEIQTDFGTTETDVSTYTTYQSFVSLAKIDGGNVVWNQTYYLPGQPLPNPASPVSYGTSNGASVQFMLETSDGGYLLGGSYTLIQQIFSDHITKPWLIRTDSSGNAIWVKTFDVETTADNNGIKSGTGNAKSAIETIDGDFLVIGNIDGYAIVKFDSTGTVVWSSDRITNGNAQEYKVYSSITKTTDGGYLLAGNNHVYNDTYPYGTGYLAKLESNFTVQWSKNYSDYWLNQLSQKYSANGRYYFSAGFGYSYILETDFYGNVKKVASTNGTINGLIPLNGGYLLVGAAESDPSSSIDTMNVWVEKLGDSTVNPSPYATAVPSPSVPEFPFAYALAVIALFVAAGAVYTKKHNWLWH